MKPTLKLYKLLTICTVQYVCSVQYIFVQYGSTEYITAAAD